MTMSNMWISVFLITFVLTVAAQLSTQGSWGHNIKLTDAEQNARRQAISGLLFRPQKRDIVFPGPVSVVSPCPNNETFCEDKTISKYMFDDEFKRKLEKYKTFFVSDEVIPVIGQRSGGTEEYLCDASEKIVRPDKAKTIAGNWEVVINGDGFEQGIRIETCVSEKGQCRMTDSFPMTYKTECRQKYMARQLIKKNSNNVPEPDLFQLPSCCECVLIPV